MQNTYFENFWNSFFGWESNKHRRYIDEWQSGLNSYYNRVLGKKQAVWIDTQKAYKHYVEIPELRTVIDKRAEMMSTAKPKLVNKDGEVVDNHWANKLLSNPNPTQSWSDVIYSLSVNDALYSNSFAYCPKRSLGVRNLIVPLPSDKVEMQLTGTKFKQMTIDGLIENIKFHYDDEQIETIEMDDLVYITTCDGMNLVNPVSRLDSLKFPLSNIKAQYNKRNVLLENIGTIGLLSAQNSDMAGSIGMTPEEKREIQRDWFNRSKDELIITEADAKWTPMSYPTKELMLFEELTADKLAIIDLYGLNSYIFSQEKGATYSNVRDGLRMSYNNTIIPETEKIYNAISEQIGLDKEGLRIVPDFSHLVVLQEDEEKKSRSLFTRANALEKIKNAGIKLDEDEKRAILGLDESR